MYYGILMRFGSNEKGALLNFRLSKVSASYEVNTYGVADTKNKNLENLMTVYTLDHSGCLKNPFNTVSDHILGYFEENFDSSSVHSVIDIP